MSELVMERIAENLARLRLTRAQELVSKIAGLPFAKTIEEYDFGFHESLDKRSVMSLFDLDFIGKKENVIFLGPPGVGKTHLATALAIKACYAGISIYFTTMADLIGKLKKDADTPEAPWLSSTRSATCPSAGRRPICSFSSSRAAMSGPAP